MKSKWPLKCSGCICTGFWSFLSETLEDCFLWFCFFFSFHFFCKYWGQHMLKATEQSHFSVSLWKTGIFRLFSLACLLGWAQINLDRLDGNDFRQVGGGGLPFPFYVGTMFPNQTQYVYKQMLFLFLQPHYFAGPTLILIDMQVGM